MHLQLFEQSFAFCAKVHVLLCPRTVCQFNRVIRSFFRCLQQSSRDLAVHVFLLSALTLPFWATSGMLCRM